MLINVCQLQLKPREVPSAFSVRPISLTPASLPTTTHLDAMPTQLDLTLSQAVAEA